MTSRLIRRAVRRCRDRLVCAPRADRDRGARRVPTSGPRRSGVGQEALPQYCSQCHGEKGTAKATPPRICAPRPRDFTSGKFKVRTTPNGALPTHQDLVNIIRRGMPYTSMPAWPDLSDQEVSDLAYFIKTFSADFSNPENVPQPVTFRSAPRATNRIRSSSGRSSTRRPAA